MMQRRSVHLITADYEAAMWQSVRGLLPNVRLVGCLFHYSQALYRQIQALGLQHSYQTDVGTKSLARCFMALPVLPPEHIPQVFQMLVDLYSTAELANFVQYIRTQWIHGPVFSARDISVFGLETRTNNDVEGYHSRINTKAGAGKLHDIINNRFNVCTYRYSSDIATDLPQVTISCSFKRQIYVYHIGPYILFRFPCLLQTLSFLECGGRVRKKNCVGGFQGGEGSKKGPQGFKGCH